MHPRKDEVKDNHGWSSSLSPKSACLPSVGSSYAISPHVPICAEHIGDEFIIFNQQDITGCGHCCCPHVRSIHGGVRC